MFLPPHIIRVDTVGLMYGLSNWPCRPLKAFVFLTKSGFLLFKKILFFGLSPKIIQFYLWRGSCLRSEEREATEPALLLI